MKIKSFAKINLTLEILGKHENSYHEIKGVFQAINLFDTIEILDSKIDEVTTKNVIINERENLVYKILVEFKRYFRIKKSFSINITKNIPISSGLGGGSSNAASVIANLNNYLGINLSKIELMSFVSKFGSDIPFFIEGGTCLISGKGEVVEKITKCKNEGVILITPNIIIKNKTKNNFSLISKKNFTDGSKTDQVKEIIMNKSLLQNKHLFNVFNSLIRDKYSEVEKVANRMNKSYGICLLSGAGTSLFTIASNNIIDNTGRYYSLVNKGWENID